MKYLGSRGFNEDDVRRWGLGYTKVARISSDNSEAWEQLKKSTAGFRMLEERVIIPLRNLLGRVNGIQTRDLEKKKYVQYLMPEARSVGAFFGLREALPEIRRTRRVFVHEGAFNAMSFWGAFPNSVASLTSFLGEAQYETLRFLADMIVLVFDDDKAGDIGRKKMIDAYGTSGVEFVTFPGADVNERMRTMGAERFAKWAKSMVPVVLQG